MLVPSKNDSKTKTAKVWTDKGTEFKGAFKNLCDQEGMGTYSTQSEWNIRSLKNIIYKHLEHKWTYPYKNKLINSRGNRLKKLAPNEVTKKHIINDLLQRKNQQNWSRNPDFKLESVQIAKLDIPFEKGCKQNLTDEISTIRRIATLNPPTYNLTGADGEIIQGKFDIYRESIDSMNSYKDKTMSVFRNMLAHPINLEGDWRVALAEIIHPTNVKNITTTDYMIYTSETPYDSTLVIMKGMEQA